MTQEVVQAMQFRVRVLFILAATAVATLVPAAGAQAGNSIWLEFCQAAADRSVVGFAAIQDRGLIARKDCREAGAVEEGLMARTARDTVRGRRRFQVRYRDVAGLVFRAPPGTVIKSVRWGGAARRYSCDWLAQLRIADEDQPTVKNELLAGHRRDSKRCQEPFRLHTAARPEKIRSYPILNNRRYDVPRPKTLIQRVVCVNRRGCPLGSHPQAYVVTQNLRIEIVDEQAPGQLAASGGDLFGGWINNDRTLSYSASDEGSGVKSVRAVNDSGSEIGKNTNNCLFTRPIPCPNGGGSLSVHVGRARQGTQSVALQAFDAADNPTVLVHAGQMQVDTVAPGAVEVSVDGGSAWRNTAGHTLRWSNVDNAGDVAPITGTRYRVCPKDARCTATPASTSTTDQIAIDAGPGETDVSVWRLDAAGNENAANSSVPVTLRYDPEAPQVAFEPLDASDPTRLVAPVSDRYSGLAGGQIELGQLGSGVWQTLPTQQEGSKLVARVDDSKLPAGAYQARVVARDQAGNSSVSEQTSGGQPMVLQLPLRVESRLSGGVAHDRIVKRKLRRKGKRRVVRRRVTVYRASARTRLGRRVNLGGVLTNRDGHPITGAQIQVYSTPQGGVEQLAGVIQTDAKGRYRYAKQPRRSGPYCAASASTPTPAPTRSSSSSSPTGWQPRPRSRRVTPAPGRSPASACAEASPRTPATHRVRPWLPVWASESSTAARTAPAPTDPAPCERWSTKKRPSLSRSTAAAKAPCRSKRSNGGCPDGGSSRRGGNL